MDMLDSRHRVLWRGYREQWPEPMWLLRHHQLPRGGGEGHPLLCLSFPAWVSGGTVPPGTGRTSSLSPALRLLGAPPTTLPLEGFHLTDGDSEARERGPRACPRQAGPGAQSVGRRPPPSLLLGGRLCRLPGSLPAPHASWGEGRSRRDPISASPPPAASQALCSGTAPSRAGLSPFRRTLWPALCPWSC